jgi:PHD/YefM family antitoxin component YafN of YafNO toxin-antitoxin module
MKMIAITEAKEQIEALVNDANDNHQPMLSGTTGNAILIAEEDWNSIQETLYLYSVPGMVPSIIEGGNSSSFAINNARLIRD